MQLLHAQVTYLALLIQAELWWAIETEQYFNYRSRALQTTGYELSIGI